MILLDARLARGRVASRSKYGVVAVDQRGAARLEPEKDFRLGIGDLGERREMSEMARAQPS